MSITSDIRTYADTAVAQGRTAVTQGRTAVAQGRQVLDQSLAAAEKAINLDALRTAAEPYLAQAKEYGTAVTDRAEGALTTLRGDARVAKVLDSATAVSGVVLVQVNERVVKPVQSLTGIGAKPAAPVRKPAPKPAATAPVAPRTTARTTPARSAAKKTTSS